MTFPGDGESPQAGGATLARVPSPRPAVFGIQQFVQPFDVAERSGDGLPTAVRLDDGTVTVAGTRGFCEAADFEKQPEPNGDGFAFFRAGSYVFVECPAALVGTARFAERARQKAGVAAWGALARRLWFDEPNAGTAHASPSLMTAATDLTDGTPPAPVVALGLLVDAYMDVTATPGDAVLHIPPRLAPDLWAKGVVRVVNGRTVGPLDIPISFGPYPSDVGVDGDADSSDSTTVIAISGVVFGEVSARPFDPADTTGALEADTATVIEGHFSPRLNRTGVIAETANLFAFDPDGVFAVRVTLPSS